eukprot:Rmarinus@m.4451
MRGICVLYSCTNLLRRPRRKILRSFSLLQGRFEMCGSLQTVTLGSRKGLYMMFPRSGLTTPRFGYVEMDTLEGVTEALKLNGQHLRGFPVSIKRSECEKNQLAAQQEVAKAAARAAAGPTKLYVGNVHSSLTEEDLSDLFSTYGDVESCVMGGPDYAYVRFKTSESAKKALSGLNGMDFGGQELKIGLVSDGGPEAGASGTGGNAPAAPEVIPGTVGELDDGDRGYGLSSTAKLALMQKLQRQQAASIAASTTPTSALKGNPVIAQAPLPPPEPQSTYNPPLTRYTQDSEYIVLTNMFDPKDTSDDMDVEIREDVEDECAKFSPVDSVHVDTNSMGCVYVKMASVAGAAKAIAGINGRFFAGKSISCYMVDPAMFREKVATL